MEWPDVTESPLFKMVRAKQLPHPTNGAFDPARWREAALALPILTDRDRQLATSAIYYGNEIASLRASAVGKLVTGNRARDVRLLAAVANQQFLTLRSNTRKKLKQSANAHGHRFELMNQQLLTNAGGQEMNADDLSAYLVDTLPHWLHHIWNDPAEDVGQSPAGDFQFGGRALLISSIEHCLRDLWHGALWQENRLASEGNGVLDTPSNRQLAEKWFIWDIRRSGLLAWEHHIDAGAAIVAGKRLPPVDPVLRRTVVRVERRPNGMPKYVIGNAAGHRGEQRGHVSERDMLDRLYTGLFLDEPLPKPEGVGLTCRELNSAWWVLQDLAHAASSGLTGAVPTDDAALGELALSVEIHDLVRMIAECLEIEEIRARAIADLLTCDPADANRLFNKGMWAVPLLPEPGSDRRYILLPQLLVGSPLRRVELWLEACGLTDQKKGVKGRGKPFEAEVRRLAAEELAENEAIDDFKVHAHGVKRRGSSAEIDLLLRIGKTVIVGEVKCFVSPSEALEKHNYLNAVAEAAQQARDKTDWASANLEQIGRLLDAAAPAEAGELRLQPVVILNQSFGIGLSRFGVPIVDLHYLRLLLGSADYQGDTLFERDAGMTFQPVRLYYDQADLEARLADLLENPPPLQRYEDTVGWRRIPFESSSGMRSEIEIPTLIDRPGDEGAFRRLAEISKAYRTSEGYISPMPMERIPGQPAPATNRNRPALPRSTGSRRGSVSRPLRG